MAYCLLGLFRVNMPPLYGEGEKAFLRLQLEILKMSDDESIFAWTSQKDFDGGMLAPSPASFKDAGNIERGKWDAPSYTMTNKGLRMDLRLLKHWGNHTSLARDDALIAPLNCNRANQLGQLAVVLKKIAKDQYVRTLPTRLLSMRELPHAYESSPRTGLYIRQYDSPPATDPSYVFYIPILDIYRAGYSVSEKYLTHSNQSRWVTDPTGQYILTLDAQNICGALVFAIKESRQIFVLVIDVRLNCPGADVFLFKVHHPGARSYCDLTKDTPRRDKVVKQLSTVKSRDSSHKIGSVVLSLILKEMGIFSKHQYVVDMSVKYDFADSVAALT
jgi:hypothetical protein